MSTEKSEQEEYILQSENVQSVVSLMGYFFVLYRKAKLTALRKFWNMLKLSFRRFGLKFFSNVDYSEVAHLTVNRLVKIEFNMNGLISRGRYFQNLNEAATTSISYKIQVKWSRRERESKQFLDIRAIHVLLFQLKTQSCYIFLNFLCFICSQSQDTPS